MKLFSRIWSQIPKDNKEYKMGVVVATRLNAIHAITFSPWKTCKTTYPLPGMGKIVPLLFFDNRFGIK